MNFAKLLQYDKDAFFKRCAQYELWYALAEKFFKVV